MNGSSGSFSAVFWQSMEFSILEFRITKQFFGRTAFFCGLLWSLWVFSAVFLRCRTQIPLPTSLFCRQRLGDEKKILRRAALPENGNGHQVSLLAAPTFIEQHLPVEIQMLKLDIPHFHTAQSATVDQADEQSVFQEFGTLKHSPDFFTA